MPVQMDDGTSWTVFNCFRDVDSSPQLHVDSESSLNLASETDADSEDALSLVDEPLSADDLTCPLFDDEAAACPSLLSGQTPILDIEGGLDATGDGRTDWRPGADTGAYLGRGASIGKQAQILVVNVIVSLQRLGLAALRALRQTFDLQCDRLSLRVGARLLCLPMATVRNIYYSVRKQVWQPIGKKERGRKKREEEHTTLPLRDELDGLRALVRIAVGNCSERGSHVGFVREAQRLSLAGVHVAGIANYEFSRMAVSFAAMVLTQMDAEDFNAILPGLGIPSDFSGLADPVSLGVGVRSRHDTLCVLCLNIISRWTGCSYTPMHSAPAMPHGAHGGEMMANLLLSAFTAHPAHWEIGILRARMASVCGDGGLCEGGPEHRHNSSRAAEILWRRVHGGLSPDTLDCTVWDPFHRVDNAAWRAIRRVPLAVRLFDTSRQLDHLFAQSEGVLVYRGAAEYLGEEATSVKAPGGTRKIGYLAGTPSSILSNLKTIVAALHARIKWCQMGHSKQTVTGMLELGNELASVPYVVFACTFNDIMCKGLRPFTLQVQGVLEAATLLRYEQRMRDYFASALRLLPKVVSSSDLLITQVTRGLHNLTPCCSFPLHIFRHGAVLGAREVCAQISDTQPRGIYWTAMQFGMAPHSSISMCLDGLQL